MLVTKTYPSGIDWYIQNLQTRLYNSLIDAKHWNLSDTSQFVCYGRAYRNKTNDGYMAQVFDTTVKEYTESYWNDSLTAVSFFGLSNTPVKTGVMNEADVHLVMFCNLVKLQMKDKQSNAVAHRGDEELHVMVQEVIGRFGDGFKMDSIETGLENVLKEYPGSRRDQRLKHVDVHPIHCFRINLKLSYNPNKNC